MNDERHGTVSGWSRHQKANERPCEPCYLAKADYDRRRLASPVPQVRNRLKAQAQARAVKRLRRLHLEQWDALYAEEIAKVRQENPEVFAKAVPQGTAVSPPPV